MTLHDILDDPDRKARFIEQGVALIESEVASKRGLSGTALRTGYKGMKKVKPGIVPGALDMLLPHFAPAVEPHFEAAQASGDVEAYFTEHAEPVAEAMLQVTDARADRAKNRTLQKIYRGLRGQAKKHTTEAMPGVGRLLAQFT